MWYLITAPAAGSCVRDSSHARNVVFSSFRAALFKYSEGVRLNYSRIPPMPPSPIAVPYFVPKSQCSRVCAHSFTVSVEKVSYLLNLPFYSFWAQNQFREPDGKRHHAVSSIVLISSHFPCLLLTPHPPLGSHWNFYQGTKSPNPYMWRGGPWLTSSDSCWVHNHTWNQLSQPVTFLKTDLWIGTYLPATKFKRWKNISSENSPSTSMFQLSRSIP